MITFLQKKQQLYEQNLKDLAYCTWKCTIKYNVHNYFSDVDIWYGRNLERYKRFFFFKTIFSRFLLNGNLDIFYTFSDEGPQVANANNTK